jgi:hemerythrin-like metal-binding protein
MALFIWTNTLSTGNSHVDDDHRTLVEKVNAVLECIARRAENAELSVALDDLAQFTREHFQQEEAVMQRAAYARAAEHAAEHAALLNQMDEVLAQLRTDAEIDGMALYTRLTRWVIDHIQTFDREFAQSETATPDAA